MLRSSSLPLIRCLKLVPPTQQSLASTRNLRVLTASADAACAKFHHLVRTNPATTTTTRRVALSTQSNDNNQKEKTEVKDSSSQDGETTSELVLTPGEKVVAASRLLTWSAVLAFAGVCGYYIVRELFPSKMSPNRAFDRAFQVVKTDPEVRKRFGDIVKAYGRDHGGRREGRRNFIEHTEYTSQEDGSKRTRIRFNLEARGGEAFVFAEVSSKMKDGEFVYVLVQDKANGRVITLIDNRAAITAARLAGDNKEGLAAMTQLLTGSGKKN